MSKISQLPALTGADLANGDQFLVTDVGSPNVSKSITADELAQGGQFSSRYKPLGSDALFIEATQFIDTFSTTSLGTLGNAGADNRRVGVRLFPDSDRITTALAWVPLGWSTVNCYVWWSNASASSGDVRWAVSASMLADGTNTDTAPTVWDSLTFTAPSQYILARSQVGTAETVTAGGIVRLILQRSASSPTDTLAANAGVLGIELVRAS